MRATPRHADRSYKLWQMCVIQGDAPISKGSPEVKVKPYFLSTLSDALAVVQVNWKKCDSKC